MNFNKALGEIHYTNKPIEFNKEFQSTFEYEFEKELTFVNDQLLVNEEVFTLFLIDLYTHFWDKFSKFACIRRTFISLNENKTLNKVTGTFFQNKYDSNIYDFIICIY